MGKEKKGKVKFVAFLAPNEWRCWVSCVTNNESFELDCFFKFWFLPFLLLHFCLASKNAIWVVEKLLYGGVGISKQCIFI